jgi:hypothetical protein
VGENLSLGKALGGVELHARGAPILSDPGRLEAAGSIEKALELTRGMELPLQRSVGVANGSRGRKARPFALSTLDAR